MNARESKEARAIIPEATIALTSSHSRDTPPASGNTALAWLPFSGQSRSAPGSAAPRNSFFTTVA